MSVCQEVIDFVAMGPLPRESEDLGFEAIERLAMSLTRIKCPITQEEAKLLATCFGPDSCRGLAWTLVHIIESAKGGVPFQEFSEEFWNNIWIDRLADRNGYVET